MYILTFIWDEVLRTVSLADILVSWLDFFVDAPEPPKECITNTARYSPFFGTGSVVTRGSGWPVDYCIIAGT